jgi:hypothetical protein
MEHRMSTRRRGLAVAGAAGVVLAGAMVLPSPGLAAPGDSDDVRVTVDI